MRKGVRKVEIIELTIDNEKVLRRMTKEKRSYTSIPEGCVRAIVLKEHEGMSGLLFVGDIVDFPERRFKSLCNRGVVARYEGDSGTTARR